MAGAPVKGQELRWVWGEAPQLGPAERIAGGVQHPPAALPEMSPFFIESRASSLDLSRRGEDAGGFGACQVLWPGGRVGKGHGQDSGVTLPSPCHSSGTSVASHGFAACGSGTAVE